MAAPLRVAIAQAENALLDVRTNLARACRAVAEAAAAGARLVALGESWLSGYPAWIDHAPNAARWGDEAAKALFARLHAASITIPGVELAELQACAARHGVVVVLGATERVETGPGNGSLYNVLLVVDDDGALAVHHRKLVPTYSERLLFAPGDGEGLGSARTGVGRVGGLVCWEHWMPLARHALHEDGEHVHVALWPDVHEAHQLASRHYAFEGRCFVLACGSLLPSSGLPSELPSEPGRPWALRGGSAIYGPLGDALAEPVFEREALVVADLDLERLTRERMTLDVSGHYHRPDVIGLMRRGSRSRVRDRFPHGNDRAQS